MWVKRICIALLCATMLLLAACGTEEEPSAAELEIAEGNYASKVFDTFDDANKLTARYLYMTKDTPTTNDMITTGDSTVYTSPEGKIMLVDCSNPASGDDVVSQLQRMGVEKIDILVLSHPHADHIGGFEAVVNAFPVEQIYMAAHEYDSGTYRRMIELIKEKELPCSYLEAGSEFRFGEQVDVKCYGPLPEDLENIMAGYMDDNNCSLALRLTYGESSFWTSGDIYANQEQYLVDTYGEEIRSDVVKMNHHGWDTSNCKNFVAHMQPKVAVAMHDSITSRTTAMRYYASGVLTFYNCVDGAVKVSTPGDGSYAVQTQFVRELDYFGTATEEGAYALAA